MKNSILTHVLFISVILIAFTTTNRVKAQWSEIGGTNTSTFNNYIHCMTTDSIGNVYIAGQFTNANGKYYVAKWNGTSWSELGGTNTSTFNGIIYSIIQDTKGNIYVGGSFKNSNGKQYVAKWNGTTWSELGGNNTSTFGSTIWCITTFSNNIYAAGYFVNTNNNVYVAKWDGNSWSELGGSNTSIFKMQIHAIATDAIGNLYAGVTIYGTTKYNCVEKWNGTSWIELGDTLSRFNSAIWTILIDSSNNVFAAGAFTNSNSKKYVAKWNGIIWSELDGTNTSTFNSNIWKLTSNKSGNVIYAAGDFYITNFNCYVAIWDGNSWLATSGLNSYSQNTAILSICIDRFNNLYVTGQFTNQNGNNYVGKYIEPQNNITGKITTLKHNAIKGVTIKYTGSSNGNKFTDSTGVFNLVLSIGNYTISPTKNNEINKTNGITAIDITLTQAHILGKNLLNSPYKLIAADVNGDGKVTALDIVYMKRLILGLDTTFTNASTKQNRLWAFVDSSYKFADSTNPFPFKDSISYSNLNANKTNQTFIGIKLGDVNQDWNPALARMPSQQFVKPKRLKLYE